MGDAMRLRRRIVDHSHCGLSVQKGTHVGPLRTLYMVFAISVSVVPTGSECTRTVPLPPPCCDGHVAPWRTCRALRSRTIPSDGTKAAPRTRRKLRSRL